MKSLLPPCTPQHNYNYTPHKRPQKTLASFIIIPGLTTHTSFFPYQPIRIIKQAASFQNITFHINFLSFDNVSFSIGYFQEEWDFKTLRCQFSHIECRTCVTTRPMGIRKITVFQTQSQGVTAHSVHKGFDIVITALVLKIETTKILLLGNFIQIATQIVRYCHCNIVSRDHQHSIECILQSDQTFLLIIDPHHRSPHFVINGKHQNFKTFGHYKILLDDFIDSIEGEQFRQTRHILNCSILISFYDQILIHVVDQPLFSSNVTESTLKQHFLLN